MYPCFSELENRKEVVISMLIALQKQEDEIKKQVELLNAEMNAINSTIDLHTIHNVKIERKE